MQDCTAEIAEGPAENYCARSPLIECRNRARMADIPVHKLIDRIVQSAWPAQRGESKDPGSDFPNSGEFGLHFTIDRNLVNASDGAA